MALDNAGTNYGPLIKSRTTSESAWLQVLYLLNSDKCNPEHAIFKVRLFWQEKGCYTMSLPNFLRQV